MVRAFQEAPSLLHANKREVTRKFLDKACFDKVILMPGEDGPELSAALQTPGSIIWAIERKRRVHAKLILKGCRSTPKPEELDSSLRYIKKEEPEGGFTLIYLDLYTALTNRYLEDITFVLTGDLLKYPSMFLLTTGPARMKPDAQRLEAKARRNGWNEEYIATPMHIENILRRKSIVYREMTHEAYRSHSGLYVVTCVIF